MVVLVTGWLLTDPSVSKADALKTGGLAGGAILALYGLWINDRRRRTEEARHEVERARAELDRDKTSDERFAKSVELLGHQADQVRVGALHALAGLARNRPDYTQTVLDVLCSYLRRPFTHPGYDMLPEDPDQATPDPDDAWPADEIATADRERQVRRTAQRLIADLLPSVADDQPTLYDLDLTSANVEYLDLTGRQIGWFTARRARFYGISRLASLRVQRRALFSGARFHGRTDFYRARFDGGLSFRDTRFDGILRLIHAVVSDFVDLKTPAPARLEGWLTHTEGTAVRLEERTQWVIKPEPATCERCATDDHPTIRPW
nr:pentapeptide repeat-containing protein [Pseudonocardia spinosispora]